MLAQDAVDSGALGSVDGFVVATDARRREVYWAGYDGAGVRVEGPAVARPADVPRDGRPVVGRGAQLYADVLGDVPGDVVGPLDPSGAALARLVLAGLAAGAVFDQLEPRYLRRPDVMEPSARKRVGT